MKKICPHGVVCPCPVLTHMYITTIFKDIFLLKCLENQSQISCSLGRGKESLYWWSQVTWPRWPPCPYMVKSFKNLFLQSQSSYDFETRYASSGTQALQSLYKWWPWVDLDLFYVKAKLDHLCVWIRKLLQSHLMRKTCIKELNWLNIFFMKIMTPGGFLHLHPLPQGYMYMITIFKELPFFKLLGQ